MPCRYNKLRYWGILYWNLIASVSGYYPAVHYLPSRLCILSFYVFDVHARRTNEETTRQRMMPKVNPLDFRSVESPMSKALRKRLADTGQHHKEQCFLYPVTASGHSHRSLPLDTTLGY